MVLRLQLKRVHIYELPGVTPRLGGVSEGPPESTRAIEDPFGPVAG